MTRRSVSALQGRKAVRDEASAEERRPLLLTGQLRRQIFTVKGKTANYSSGTRLFTADQKNALLVEARGQCTTHGCDNPWTMLTADHTTPWSMTHHTCVADGSIKCDPCNNWKSNITGRS